jgi:hypothetical protein
MHDAEFHCDKTAGEPQQHDIHANPVLKKPDG